MSMLFTTFDSSKLPDKRGASRSPLVGDAAAVARGGRDTAFPQAANPPSHLT